MNFWKSYGAHMLGYITSAATIATTLTPGMVPPTWAPYVGGTGVIALLLTAAHNIQTANVLAILPPPVAQPPAAAPAPSSTGPVVKALLPIALVLAAVCGAGAGLTGCASTPTAQQQAGISAAIYVAAGAAIQQGSSDPAVWKERATQFKTIAVEVQQITSTESATLPTLAADLNPLVAKLGPADVLAANALIGALTPYLQQQVQSDPSLAKFRASVDFVLAAVIGACSAYGA